MLYRTTYVNLIDISYSFQITTIKYEEASVPFPLFFVIVLHRRILTQTSRADSTPFGISDKIFL